MRIDVLVAGSCVALGIGPAPLHGQEGADALDLALEAAVRQRLALGAQPTGRHPLSILLLLGWGGGAGVREGEDVGGA